MGQIMHNEENGLNYIIQIYASQLIFHAIIWATIHQTEEVQIEQVDMLYLKEQSFHPQGLL